MRDQRKRGGGRLTTRLDLDLAGAEQRLQAFSERCAAAGAPIDVGRALTVFPARSAPLDHAAIAWADAAGIPSPPNPTYLGAELVVTSAGLAYSTIPVPYVWWRRWSDVLCSPATVGRPRWRQQSESVFVVDRVAPFEGRAFELPIAAFKAFMDLAVQQGAVGTRPPS